MVVQGCLFTDAGSAWGDSSLTGETQAAQFHMLWSAGAGLRINMVKFAGAILRLDWAQTLSPNEGVGFSLGIGQFF
jgi:outer membrane protein assembly factor BamA